MSILEFVSTIFEFIGTILVAFTALKVHHRMLMEHKIDTHVFRAIKREQIIGVIGIALIVTGFFVDIIVYLTGA